MKKKVIFLILICLPFAAYFFVSSSLNSKKFIFVKNLIPHELRQDIKKKVRHLKYLRMFRKNGFYVYAFNLGKLK